MSEKNFWVVIPFFDEEKLIGGTLEALAAQDDRDFELLLVDNASTDGSRAVIDAFSAQHPEMSIRTIEEAQKGTGAASDTGFRHAIAAGAAIVARTDADSLPDPRWVGLLKADFRTGARIVGGKVKPRTDEPEYRWYDGVIGAVLIGIIERAPRYLYRRPGQRYPMFMVPGLNMAIDADLYLEVDGFPRSSIDDTDEDLELHLKVCQLIPGGQARFDREAVVRCSIRKGKKLGYLGILLWYWGRKKRTDVVDIR
ncbi:MULTISPECIES: glycosyltransferase [unclassified Rathayibacter]|uniref:glycosyltransferase n=1 Tax=unclassified Rathayibacter TaxID=2609250 RepID=UPI001FB4EB27|nr:MULTISPECIES: glycosyltransferase [unclassified Rathayibacter]MCJ1673899.1 glycosyltransferase [Rathayibacter sp. VKM Ac-2929]MCJ1683105.1 glycosyltransferase [Rathayibacter sp. VKM Ac-2928]MCJ1687982.1 glycosyltransferase [Rathayibacter sp. VKM Ac-2927]